MKNIYILSLIWLTLCLQCASPTDKKSTDKKTVPAITVGVFDGHGGAQTCIWETLAALRLDPGIQARTITSAEIAEGILDSLDAIVIPGGSGSRQYLNLGSENQKRIRDFIADGHGAVGICAGAYLFSNTPGYACMALNGAQAIDIEHDNRGHGLSKFTLNEEGKKIFPELSSRDTCYVIYYEGPVFIPSAPDSIRYTLLATMQSDVHEEGNAPAGMTNGKPFFIANQYGKGRVFSSIAHPEATPGMMWMIPRMIRWTLGKPLISYKENTVQPALPQRELLMTTSGLQQESECFQTKPKSMLSTGWKTTIPGMPNAGYRVCSMITHRKYVSVLPLTSPTPIICTFYPIFRLPYTMKKTRKPGPNYKNKWIN